MPSISFIYIELNHLDRWTHLATTPRQPYKATFFKSCYEQAGIEYPEERRKLYGAAKKEIRDRASSFEEKVIYILEQRGEIFKQYKTDAGRLDALFIDVDTIYAVEIKDYHTKPISHSELKQLNRYIDSIPHCHSGLLVTHKDAKKGKNKIYIEKNRISILTIEEISERFAQRKKMES